MDDVFTIFGISISEMLFIVVVLFLFFSVDEIAELFRSISNLIRYILKSEIWKGVTKDARAIREVTSGIYTSTVDEDILRNSTGHDLTLPPN